MEQENVYEQVFEPESQVDGVVQAEVHEADPSAPGAGGVKQPLCAHCERWKSYRCYGCALDLCTVHARRHLKAKPDHILSDHTDQFHVKNVPCVFDQGGDFVGLWRVRWEQSLMTSWGIVLNHEVQEIEQDENTVFE